MAAVVAIVRASAVGEPAPTDPLVALAADGVEDGCPPIVNGEQDHANDIFDEAPADVKHTKDDGPQTAVAIVLGGQHHMLASAFRTSWIHS